MVHPGSGQLCMRCPMQHGPESVTARRAGSASGATGARAWTATCHATLNPNTAARRFSKWRERRSRVDRDVPCKP